METDTYAATVMCDGAVSEAMEPRGCTGRQNELRLREKGVFPEECGGTLRRGSTPRKGTEVGKGMLEQCCKSICTSGDLEKSDIGQEKAEHGHDSRGASSRVQRLVSELKGRGGRGKEREQEANTSFHTSAGPALPQVLREMDGAAPALFSACYHHSLSCWLWPVHPTRPWGGAGVMGVGSSL